VHLCSNFDRRNRSNDAKAGSWRAERTELWREEVKGIRTGRVIVLVRIGYTAAQGLSSVEFSKD